MFLAAIATGVGILVTKDTLKAALGPAEKENEKWGEFKARAPECIELHKDFRTFPPDVWKHVAFAYAAYEKKSEDKGRFNKLRGYTRCEHEDNYSIFKHDTDQVEIYKESDEAWIEYKPSSGDETIQDVRTKINNGRHDKTKFRLATHYIVTARGTDPLNRSDLEEDLIIFKRNDTDREDVILKEVVTKLNGKKGRVSFTGHSLGGTIASHIFKKLKNPRLRKQVEGLSDGMTLDKCYSFNPGCVPQKITTGMGAETETTIGADTTEPWEDALKDSDQCIIINKGDVVPIGLASIVDKMTKTGAKTLEAKIHVVRDLQFQSSGSFVKGLGTWVGACGGLKATPENLLLNKIQVHEMGSFFSTSEMKQAYTRAQVDHYLLLESLLQESQKVDYDKLLESGTKREAISVRNLAEKNTVKSTLHQQCADSARPLIKPPLSLEELESKLNALRKENANQNWDKIREKVTQKLKEWERIREQYRDNLTSLAKESSFSDLLAGLSGRRRRLTGRRRRYSSKRLMERLQGMHGAA